MRALVFDQKLSFDPAYPEPVPGPGEALVRVLKAGICNTDLEIVQGYMGFKGILGHEFVGLVQGGEWDGKRVAGEINLACGNCETCHQGISTQCPNRATLGIFNHNGAFADYLTLPQANLRLLPDEISDEQAVFIEPLAAALQILHMTHISPHHRVVVLGAGKLGLLAAQVIALQGCHLSVVVHHLHQNELLSEWGIDVAVFESIEPKSIDVVVDCTGTEEGFADALTLVRPRGIIHLKSTYHAKPVADMTRVVVDEVTVTSSRCGPFDAAIRLLKRYLIEVEPLIDARYSLDHGLDAMVKAGQKGVLKVLLEMG
ncbi:MAG: alcohol dehydrogenase catalytic domain-containing protein [Anaerolineae bacterium]|nr:alcohol dehydrogenase catalytic domain-containing protein [Anaerolineae bacterium]